MLDDDFDLWKEEREEEKSVEEDLKILKPKEIILKVNEKDRIVEIYSKSNLLKIPGVRDLQNFECEKVSNGLKISCLLNSPNAFMLVFLFKGLPITNGKDDYEKLRALAQKVNKPFGRISDTGKTIDVKIPLAKPYKDLVSKIDARPMGDSIYRISLSRSLDLELIAESMQQRIPKIKLDDEIIKVNRKPIPGFDGTIDSLKNISINELHIIQINMQSWKEKKNSKKTLEEKFNEFGISTLHDLIFNVPRRFIDKSEPQEISDLIEGESSTIVGKVVASGEISNSMGAWFLIATDHQNSIRASFFRQSWLLNKFKVGSDVLVTGKVNLWMGQKQLGGTSIEHSDEASILPIVPVYKQSESKGITTRLILNAIRETFARIEATPIKIPPFLRDNQELKINDSIRNLHLPDSMEFNEKAIDTMAFYELLEMQILMKYFASKASGMEGLSQKQSPQKLQRKVIESLPFKMTGSQESAIEKLNKSIEKGEHTSTLLTADVGAGKTLIAQIASVRCVEAKGQAAIIAPTEILATQLFESFEKTLEILGDYCTVKKLTGSTRVRERKKVLAGLEDGTVNIVVGTGSLLSETVKYKDLKFVCFDEQQKFGASQRTSILNSREDGKVPDILMQSATPVPRSTAQMFYGGLDILTLDEKPPGRLPIKTKWIREKPSDFLGQIVNPVWDEIIKEAENGKQTFIVTPIVMDSTGIDASSVKSTYETLSNGPLNSLKICFVHGQMSSKVAKENMEKFKNREYDVLIGSTAVEVGVDVPNATRVIILSADRFGASSLHQIRGRVGRNAFSSECILVASTTNKNSDRRLQALVDSEDGFEIAKVDLEVRGEGKMFARDQSGSSTMKFASILTHSHLVHSASEEAERILKSPFATLAVKKSMENNKSQERLV